MRNRYDPQFEFSLCRPVVCVTNDPQFELSLCSPVICVTDMIHSFRLVYVALLFA